MSENVAALRERFLPKEGDTQVVTIDAAGMPYPELNRRLYELVNAGVEAIVLRNVMGQRYIGTNLQKPVRIIIDGVPGNDLGAFMDGPYIELRC